MTQSSRAAALRSTVWAASLALAVGLSTWAADAAVKPKVPLPKSRPIARNAVPKTSSEKTAPGDKTTPAAKNTVNRCRGINREFAQQQRV